MNNIIGTKYSRKITKNSSLMHHDILSKIFFYKKKLSQVYLSGQNCTNIDSANKYCFFFFVFQDSSVKSTAMRENKFYVSLYLFWSKFLFIEVFPYTTILIMNIFIIIKITKSARFRKKFQRQNVDDEGENYLEVAVPLNQNSSNGLKSFEQGLT